MLPANHHPGPVALSVIVPVHNGADTLDACLEALAQQTVPPDGYEVIVVDDGSSDDSARIAARHGATVLRQRRAGAAAARNRGARQARGAILLFTDADCRPEPDWIEEMVAPLADPQVAGVKGTYLTAQRSAVARFAQAEYEEKYRRMAGMERIDFVDTYAAAYRCDVFFANGGFDSSFPTASVEDQELSFRLAEAGHRLVFAPRARVYHRHPDSLGRYARRKLHLGRWKVRVHTRHPAKALHDSYTPWSQKAQLLLLPLAAVAALAAVARRLPWRTAAILAGLGLASTAPLVNEAHHQSKLIALVAPFLALVRATALDLGLLWGLLDRLSSRR
jgi:cellulose synthase/poly-beta-1,6-N-acetylglucosamine synthase-like glycosyltransferase